MVTEPFSVPLKSFRIYAVIQLGTKISSKIGFAGHMTLSLRTIVPTNTPLDVPGYFQTSEISEEYYMTHDEKL